MGLFSRRKQPRNEAAKTTGRSRDEPMVKGYRTVAASPGDRYMTSSESIYSATSRIANTIAAMPLRLYKGDAVAWEHPLNRLVSYAPNGRMTGYLWRQTMEANACDCGNAYSVIIRAANGVDIHALRLIDPARVTPVLVDEMDAIWYRIVWPNGLTEWYPNTDVVVIRNISTNGEKGINPRHVLMSTLDYDTQVKIKSLQQLDGVNRGVIVSVPNTGLNEARRKQIIDDFVSEWRASEGSAVVLQGGMTATTISQSPVDANVLDVERITKNRVSTVYDIPPHMMGDYSDASYATTEQSMLEFLELSILPKLVQWEEELNLKLLTWEQVSRERYGFRFDMSALLRADTATMANKHQLGIRGGWIKPNEARSDDGLPPDPNGDQLLIARDLLPLEMVANGATINK